MEGSSIIRRSTPQVANSSIVPTQPVQTAPGAIAVAGPDASDGDSSDDYSYTQTDPPASLASADNSTSLLSARLVNEREEDMEALQEQLRQRDEELQRVLAERENVAVAQIIAHDDEAQHEGDDIASSAGGGDSSGRFSSFTQPVVSMAKQQVRCLCGPRMRWITVIIIILLIVGIVLGVVLPKRKQTQDLINLLSAVSPDNGTALLTPSTPQNNALNWLLGNADRSYSDERKIQRYALATLYYITNGSSWRENFEWLSDTDECGWYSRKPTCSFGSVVVLNLADNNLVASMPPEIALLTKLGEFWVSCLLLL